MPDDSAGAAPFGAAYLEPFSPQSVPAKQILELVPLVPLFDIRSRSFPRDTTTGLLKTIHWVDQAVALALGIAAGSYKSQPALGNTLRQIKRAGGPKLKTQVEDSVRLALADLIERKDANVIQLDIATPIRGQIVVVVYYVNLRLPSSEGIADKITFLF